MLDQTFGRVYTKFKLHFYKQIFSRFEDREATLTTGEDLIVIAAGYHDEMQDFLDANPGLRSRFNRTIEFPNYDAEELLEIMTNRAKSLDYTLTDDAVQYVQDTFTRILACPPENFGNARSVRNYLDRVIHNQANRLIAENNFKEEDLTKLTLADVQSETLE